MILNYENYTCTDIELNTGGTFLCLEIYVDGTKKIIVISFILRI